MKKREPKQLPGQTVRRIEIGSFKTSSWELPVEVRIGTIEISEAAGVPSRRVWLEGPLRRQTAANRVGAI